MGGGEGGERCELWGGVEGTAKEEGSVSALPPPFGSAIVACCQ